MFFILLFILTFILLISAIYYGIGPNVTPIKALRVVEKAIPEKAIVYDLGSGFGFSTYYFAKKHPNCTVIGVEASLIPFLISLIFLPFQRNLRFTWKNFYSLSFKDADIVYCYLYRKAMKNLLDKFEKELSNKAVVISYTFSLKKKAERINNLGDFYQNKLYFYKFNEG